jgi:hypothetical protein
MEQEVKIIECSQRSDAWFAARLGRVTGSKVKLLSGVLKNGSEPAGRRDYRTELVLERLTGQRQEDGYTNADMERGVRLEPEALAAYQVQTGELVTPVGFLQHDELLAGCSPDGLIGTNGLLEIKAPRPANHLAYLRGGVVPAKHKGQLIHACWIAGAAWCDFLSYCPAMPPALQTFLVRYERNEAEMAAHELIVRQFIRECDTELAQVEKMMEMAHAV